MINLCLLIHGDNKDWKFLRPGSNSGFLAGDPDPWPWDYRPFSQASLHVVLAAMLGVKHSLLVHIGTVLPHA